MAVLKLDHDRWCWILDLKSPSLPAWTAEGLGVPQERRERRREKKKRRGRECLSVSVQHRI